jgi:protein involved in polysaccharide export with SLBB domain
MNVCAFYITLLIYTLLAFYMPIRGVWADEHAVLYTLKANDEIKLTVFGEDSLSGVYGLDAAGAVSVPLIGETFLRGLTARQAEARIREKLADGYLVDPDVVIEVSRYRPVYIVGEVHAPGQYDYISDMSVLNAVALAGGFTYRANRRTVLISSAAAGVPSRDAPLEAVLMPGDVITVEERLF